MRKWRKAWNQHALSKHFWWFLCVFTVISVTLPVTSAFDQDTFDSKVSSVLCVYRESTVESPVLPVCQTSFGWKPREHHNLRASPEHDYWSKTILRIFMDLTTSSAWKGNFYSSLKIFEEFKSCGTESTWFCYKTFVLTSQWRRLQQAVNYLWARADL